MLLAFLLAAAGPSPAQDIAVFCHRQAASVGKAAPSTKASCIATQKLALKHYLGLWVMFDAPDAQAEACMRAGKVGKHVDWTKAEACLRDWSKGRRSIIARGMAE